MNPILEMLVANDMDNFNKKYQILTDPKKTTQSCWCSVYFAYQLKNQSMSNFYEGLLTSNPEPTLLTKKP